MNIRHKNRLWFQADGNTAAVVENDVRQQSSQIQQQNSRLQDKLKRQARTHALLVSIVVVFALSWFPLNVLNLILDIHDIFQVRISDLVGISKAVLNGHSKSNVTLFGTFQKQE